MDYCLFVSIDWLVHSTNIFACPHGTTHCCRHLGQKQDSDAVSAPEDLTVSGGNSCNYSGGRRLMSVVGLPRKAAGESDLWDTMTGGGTVFQAEGKHECESPAYFRTGSLLWPQEAQAYGRTCGWWGGGHWTAKILHATLGVGCRRDFTLGMAGSWH